MVRRAEVIPRAGSTDGQLCSEGCPCSGWLIVTFSPLLGSVSLVFGEKLLTPVSECSTQAYRIILHRRSYSCLEELKPRPVSLAVPLIPSSPVREPALPVIARRAHPTGAEQCWSFPGLMQSLGVLQSDAGLGSRSGPLLTLP